VALVSSSPFCLGCPGWLQCAVCYTRSTPLLHFVPTAFSVSRREPPSDNVTPPRFFEILSPDGYDNPTEKKNEQRSFEDSGSTEALSMPESPSVGPEADARRTREKDLRRECHARAHTLAKAQPCSPTVESKPDLSPRHHRQEDLDIDTCFSL
jgi:hypothetical protein